MNSEKQPELLKTGDGSNTLYHPELDEPYHSRNGAFNESMHVFIEAGLKRAQQAFERVNVLEVGIGTGLNWLLTHRELGDDSWSYSGLEPYPISDDLVENLGFDSISGLEQTTETFKAFHSIPYNRPEQQLGSCLVTKLKAKLEEFNSPESEFNLVYYDAFGPPTQPELWEPEVFETLFGLMTPSGVLVTYCAKGSVRRNMLSAGFEVERLPGPPRKREMLRAIKPQ